jgi:hypothetical protein
MMAAELMVAFARAQWGSGYFDEVLDAVWNWMAVATDLQSIDYAVRADNPRSIRAVSRWLSGHHLPSTAVEQTRGATIFTVYSIPVCRIGAVV